MERDDLSSSARSGDGGRRVVLISTLCPIRNYCQEAFGKAGVRTTALRSLSHTHHDEVSDALPRRCYTDSCECVHYMINTAAAHVGEVQVMWR
jgi:hypothetical protein